MRNNLQIAYLSLLSVTCISSFFLFCVVFTENTKYVAAAAANVEANAAAVDQAAEPHTTIAAAAEATATPTTLAHDEVLPNYKKVKEILNDEVDETLPAGPEIAVPVDINKLDKVFGAADEVAAQEEALQSADGWLLPTGDAAEVVNIKLNDVGKNDLQKQQEAKDDADAARATSNDDLQNEKAESAAEESLPDITEIPTITVTDLPFEILEPTRVNIDALIIDAAKETIAREHENHTMEMLEDSSEVIRKDEEIIKFDDSGGGEQPQPTPQLDNANPTSSEIPQNIPNVNVTIAAAAATTQNESASAANTDTTHSGDNGNASNTLNLTVEEVPIPVFSEWAQKQMENEKQQAKEQEVVNTATQKKNHTNGDGKKRQAPLKMRNKNYASPDCGAKIIALNVDATNAGAVLSSSKDEYMLSPCGNRIWFVVELCEAIQARKVELANFELFSSSPKNFTVAVSNRFPTRDWSNVGRFIAEDTRNVQSFDLHPHLFGKFVRVDIHSHYAKEHFCPLSLFRVFGTSEFEAFETENTEHSDLDDFDDEFGQEQVQAKSGDTNLFKSASDAVLSIVKKAAEVLAKPANHLNTTLARIRTFSSQCRTPTTQQFSCADCNQSLVTRINTVISCEYQQLQALLKVPWLLKDLVRTQICAKAYGVEVNVKSANENCAPSPPQSHILEMDVKRSYYLNMLPTEIVGALCQLLATRDKTKAATNDASGMKAVTEPPLNLTIDKKVKKADYRIIDDTPKKLVTTESTNIDTGFASTERGAEGTFSGDGALPTTITTERATIDGDQLVRPPAKEGTADTMETTTAKTPEGVNNNEATHDVNIFNVPAQEQKQPQLNEPAPDGAQSEHESSGVSSVESSVTIKTTTATPPSSTDAPVGDTMPLPPSTASPPVSHGARSEEDVASWENIDNLITSTTAAPGSVTENGGAASNEAGMQANQPGVNLQQKIPSGPQSESIFIRLSNRIKALERNMSLSGQYLEELSRRYKKQFEDLTLTLTQTVQTVRTLEEHSRRQSELHQLLAQRNSQLKDELDDLSLQVHACIAVIIFVGAFVFLALMVSILFYRSMRRETKEILTLYTNANKKKTAAAVAAMQRKLNRRKSCEDFSDHQQSCEKLRRPSEEALMILKDRSSSGREQESIETVGDAGKHVGTQRERKISICYSGNVGPTAAAQSARQRRKGEKHSWPNTEHAQQQARRHLEQLRSSASDAAELKPNFEKINGRPPRAPPHLNGGESKSVSANKARRKSQAPRRQASVPNDFVENIPTAAELSAAEYDESLRLEEDDLDNFIPTSDLAYNEFMPEGPSGYQVDDSVDGNAESRKSAKKLGRLSAPAAFFKSPFGKSRNKLRTNKTPAKHPHESTSWEWYRSKNADAKQALSVSASASAGFMRASPTHSLDTSSLSEILLPNSRTENSFRILEEAILSSGESIAANSVTTNGTTATTDNGNSNGNNTYNSNGSHHSNGSSIASNSNRSSTSSTSTKKNKRSFNKIFRKVF